MNRNVDQIVRDKLLGLEKEPPGYVWSAINDQMLRNKQRKRVLVFWQSVAAAAVLILTLGIAYLFNNDTEHKRMAVVKKAAKETNTGLTDKNPSSETALTDNIAVASNKIVSDKKEQENANSARPAHAAAEKNITSEKGKNYQASKFKNISGTALPLTAMVKKEKNQANIPAQENKQSGSEELKTISTTGIFAEKPEMAASLVSVKKKKKQVIYPLYASNTIPAYQPKAKRHKFLISGTVSPTYNYRSIGETPASVVTASNNGSYNESGIVSVAGGINVRMESKSRWSFETGVLYSQVGQEVSQTNVYPSIAGMSSLAAYSRSGELKNTAINISNNTGNSLGEIRFPQKTPMAVEKGLVQSGVYLAEPMNTLDQQPAAATLKQLLDYIEIPLTVRYALLNSKTLITLSGGLSTNFLIDNTAYLTENGKQIDAGSTEGISPVTYSSSVGLGIELPVGKAFRFSLEPRFKYFLSPVNSNGYSNFHPYSFGVFGGVSFLLNGH